MRTITRLPVVWQPLIHELAPDSVEVVGRMLSRWNLRFGADATQDGFRQVLGYILGGQAIDPDQVAAGA